MGRNAGIRRSAALRQSGAWRRRAALVLAALILGPALGLTAQVPISNPSIPDEEQLVYVERIGEAEGLATVDLRLEAQGERSWYEVRETTARTSSLFRLERETLFPFYSEITTRSSDAVLRRSTEVLERRGKYKPDELPIAEPAALTLVLRGFPWGSRDTAHLVFLGSGDSRSFGFSLRVTGRDRLSLGGRDYDCWRAELVLDGMFGALVPKTKLWFLAQAPHYLVRYEGLIGAPGSPKRSLELRQYSAGAAH